MSSMPAAVIFDMDGVLCRYDFAMRLARMAEMTGVDAHVIEREIFDSGFDERADAGGYTAESYLEEFCARIGAPMSAEQWLEARASSMQADAEVLDMARRVARRAPTAMLTNNGPLLEAHIDRVFPEVRDIFGERAYFSSSLGACKPDPRVFERVIARLDVPPAETLFVDDCPEYLKGAAEAGLVTHHFESADALRAELEGRGFLREHS